MSQNTKTIQYRGFELEVTFDYSSAEPEERDYPGCPESFEIEKVLMSCNTSTIVLKFGVPTDDLKKIWIDVTDLLEPQFPDLADALKELKEEFDPEA